jgi:hypothetical protein
MSVVYANVLKDQRLTDVVTKLDAQTGFATLEICTAAYAVVLVVFTLRKPSFSEAAQALTLLGVPITAVAGNGGVAAVARVKDSAGTVWITGLTVGTSATDFIVNSTTITSGQTQTITGGTITHG